MNKSYFDGGIIDLVLLRITNLIILVITLGLGTPWAVVRTYRWEIEHTIIEGRRLGFDGSAWGLFAKWVWWYFLTIITLGIYGFWANININKWKAEHTFFLN